MPRLSLGQQQAAAALAASAGASDYFVATCVSIDWTNGLATVNWAQGQISIPMAGPTPPIPQRPVVVGYFGRKPVCIGVIPRSPVCTVTGAASAGTYPVTGADGGSYRVAYDVSKTYSASDQVLVDWASGGVILCKLSADPVTLDSLIPDPPVRPPTPQPTEKSQTFSPYDAGTWSETYSKWQNSDVWCSDSTLGAWFYSSAIADTIGDSATILEVRVQVAAFYTTGDAPTIGVHGSASKGGAPSVTSAVSVAGGSGWKGLPTSFGDALKTGSAKGLGTHHGGWHKWYGVTNGSGALYIRWKD